MYTPTPVTARILGIAFCAAALCTTSPAQVVPFATLHSTPGGFSGPIESLGDIDGDGLPESIVGLPGGTPSAPGVGLVRVVAGNGGSTLHLLLAGAGDEDFGDAVAPAGDLDGDGIPDLVVGAPGHALSTQPGRVHAYSGSSGQLLWTSLGASAADAYGHSLSGFGDQDGDGVPDIFVGAPLDGTGGVHAGRCAVLSGADGQTLLEAFGATAGDQLGWALCATTPGHVLQHEPEPWVSATQAGNGGSGYAARLSPVDLSTVAVVTGPQLLDRFGASLTVVGDLDGDGTADVLIGSDPQDATGAPTRPGFARVYSGATAALLREHSQAALGTGYGGTLTQLGDVNGDATPDYAIGEPFSDEGGQDAGALHVLSGADGALLHTLYGASVDLRLGGRVTAAGDVNGDGLQDLLTGSRTAATDSFWVTCVSFTPWESHSNGTAGTHGVPSLIGRGGLLPGTEVSLLLHDALENTSVTLILGTSLVLDPLHGVISPLPAGVVALQTNGEGKAQHDFAWPTEMPAGTVVYYQMRVTDDAADHGEALSNTLSATAPGTEP